MTDPLVRVHEVEQRIGRLIPETDHARMWRLIDDATATVQSHTGIDFAAAGTVTETVPIRWNRYLVLEQWPLVTVTDVVDGNGTAVDYTTPSARNGLLRVDTMPPWPIQTVDVTYTYGWSKPPPVVVAVIAQIAGRAYGTPSDRAGITSETTGPYNYQVGAAAGAGPVGVMPAEALALNTIRRRLPFTVTGTATLGHYLA